MTKKIIPAPYNSTVHLHSIIRKLLVCIEDRIECLNKDDDKEITQHQKTHELLFGNKLSIAGNLAILADLLRKFGDKFPDNSSKSAEENNYGFSEVDIALIRNFLEKIKNENETADDNASDKA